MQTETDLLDPQLAKLLGASVTYRPGDKTLFLGPTVPLYVHCEAFRVWRRSP